VKLFLRDGGFSRGRTAILPLECKREFTSRAASITGRSSHEVRNSWKIKRACLSDLFWVWSWYVCFLRFSGNAYEAENWVASKCRDAL